MDEGGGSCFPSVQDLVNMTGLTKNTVIKHIGVAEEMGWLRRSTHGYRGQKWKRAEYVARWPGRDIEGNAIDERGIDCEGGAGDAPRSEPRKAVQEMTEGGAGDAPEVVQEMHQDKTSPVTTPLTSPEERERARGDGSADIDDPKRAAFRKRVMRFCSGKGFVAGAWPDWEQSSPPWISERFAELSVDERRQAERWRDAYLLDLRRRGKQPTAVGNFLRGRLWEGLDERILAAAETSPVDEPERPEGFASCLGPVGMARLFAFLLEGTHDARAAPVAWCARSALEKAWPGIARLETAQKLRGGDVFADRWHALKDRMEAISDAGVRAAWQAEFDRRGWPWLSLFRNLEAVYFPVGGPEGLDGFAQACGASLAGNDDAMETQRDDGSKGGQDPRQSHAV